MLKELKSYITVCDCCGVERDDSSGVLSVRSLIQFHQRLLGHDLCTHCFVGFIDQLVSDRVITEDIVKETLKTFTPPRKPSAPMVSPVYTSGIGGMILCKS